MCSRSLSQGECSLNLLYSLSKDSRTKFSRVVCLAAKAATELGSIGIIGVRADDGLVEGAGCGGGGGSSLSRQSGPCREALLHSTVTRVFVGIPARISVGIVVFTGAEVPPPSDKVC